MKKGKEHNYYMNSITFDFWVLLFIVVCLFEARPKSFCRKAMQQQQKKHDKIHMEKEI